MRTALVAGATGLVGKQCMFKLLENSEYGKVVALVRKHINVSHPKLQQIVINYNNLNEMQVLDVVHDIYCCLGTTMKKAGSREAFYEVDFTYVINLAATFSKKDSENFLVVSASGASEKSPIYYSRVKAQMENALIKYKFKGIHIFRPSILEGNREEFRIGERIGIGFIKLLSPFFLGFLAKYKPIHAATVAKSMVKVSLNHKEGVFIYESDEIASM